MEARKSIRLPANYYLGRRCYFVTICCARRQEWFADSRRSRWVTERMGEEAIRQSFLVHAWCVMPDHVHLLLQGTDDRNDLRCLVKSFKQKTAHEAKSQLDLELWQRGFYDHVLRSNESISNVASYIWMNPVRKGLCAAPEGYPFSGSMTMDWREASRPALSWRPPWKEQP